MKKIIFVLATLAFTVQLGMSQKFGYIDSQAILEEMPAYDAAQKEIADLTAKWQGDLEEMYRNIEKRYKDYQAEEVLLPDDVKAQRQEEIFELERKAKEYKKSKFGFEGELYRLQDDKIKPIQSQIYEAVQLLCQEKSLDFIFDKSGNSGILYSDPKFDRTDDVKRRLGIK